MEYSTYQRAVAEFVGTFTLIFVGAGSIVAASVAGAEGGAGLVTVAIAHGLAIATMVSAIGHVSGGHLNPAVTFGAFITGKLDTVNSVAYVLAQLAGGILGALLLRLGIPESIWSTVDLGTPLVAGSISVGQAVLIEAVLTFFLVWVIFGTAIDPRGSFDKVAGLAIGFVVLMAVMMAGPFTGAAINPARSLGPELVAGVWSDWWVYWIGPLIGGGAAALVYDVVNLRPMVEENARP